MVSVVSSSPTGTNFIFLRHLDANFVQKASPLTWSVHCECALMQKRLFVFGIYLLMYVTINLIEFWPPAKKFVKVMFLLLSVSHSVHRGGLAKGAWVAKGEPARWRGDMCGKGGRAWQGGRRAWLERRPLQRAVYILLECILVSNWILKNMIPKITLHPSADFLS